LDQIQADCKCFPFEILQIELFSRRFDQPVFNLRVAGYVARAWLCRWNWDETVETIPQSGGRVVGICGGDLDNRGQHGNSNALESLVN